MIDEELIYARLFERVGECRFGDPNSPRRFLTLSRRVKLFNEVPSEMQPACFQAEHGTLEKQTTGMPYKTTLNATWIIYQAVSKSPEGIGAIENNIILKGVRTALAPKPNDPGFMDKRNTLNGLVYHCFIDGLLFKDPGDIDGQGMMTVPIKLLVP